MPSSSVWMGLGVGSWLELDVRGGQAAWAAVLLFLQDFSPSCGLLHGIQVVNYTCAIIAFRRCPPSIEEATKIKSSYLFRAENNKMNQDVKKLFLVVRYVSSQVMVMRWFGCSSRMSCLSSRGGVRGLCCNVGQEIHS